MRLSCTVAICMPELLIQPFLHGLPVYYTVWCYEVHTNRLRDVAKMTVATTSTELCASWQPMCLLTNTHGSHEVPHACSNLMACLR